MLVPWRVSKIPFRIGQSNYGRHEVYLGEAQGNRVSQMQLTYVAMKNGEFKR